MKTNFDKRNPKKFLGYLMASALVFFAGSVGATNHVVTIDSQTNSFAPSALSIDVGDSVTWTNDGGSHNVNGDLLTFPSNADGSIYSGAASSSWLDYVWVCTTAGSYDYQCDPHAGLGMAGTISAVTPGGSGGLDITVGGGSYDIEISWEIVDATGVSLTGVQMAGFPAWSGTIPAGCYSMEMYDSWGDGWNGATYSIVDQTTGQIYATGGLTAGAYGSDNVCWGVTPGCTDPVANNYDPLATLKSMKEQNLDALLMFRQESMFCPVV